MSFDLGKNESRIMKAMDDWAEDIVKNNLVNPDVSGQRELLVNFIQWLKKEYEVQEVYEMYADEYLQEKITNSH